MTEFKLHVGTSAIPPTRRVAGEAGDEN